MRKNFFFVWVILLMWAHPFFIHSVQAETLSPDKGVEVMMLRRWHASGWAGNLQAQKFSLEIVDNTFPRFTVGDPKLRLVWIYYLDLPIDFNRYPMLVLKYRAQNTASTGSYTIWLDDGTGPNNGGFSPVRSNELIADGEVHILKKDIRTFKPRGNIIGIALGVMCGDTAPAVFDLLSFNFESSPENPVQDAVQEDIPFRFLVINSKDEPIKGARVIMDAERINFSRSVITDEKGLCEVIPLKNESGKHMVRVEVEGMLPVECHKVKKIDDKPLKIICLSASESRKSDLSDNIASASLIENTQEWLASETSRIFIKFVSPDMTPLPGNQAHVYTTTAEGILNSIGIVTANEQGIGSLIVPREQIIFMQDPKVKLPGWYIPEDYYSFRVTWSEDRWICESLYGIQPNALYEFAGGSGTEKDPIVIRVGVLPSVQVKGSVVDSQGIPLKKCPVYSGFDWMPAVTDEEGVFTFPVMPGGKKIELLAMSSDRKLSGPGFFDPAKKESMKITVQPTKNYPAQVVDSEGLPVGKITLSAYPRLDGKQIYQLKQDITTDTESRFVLNNVCPDSTYYFWWNSDDETNRDFDYGYCEVKLADIKEEKILTITAKRYIECMMGKVVDNTGMPVKGVRIEVLNWEILPRNTFLSQKPILTDEKGEFSVGRLAKGKTDIRITHPDYKGVLLSGIRTDSIDVTGVLQPKGPLNLVLKVKDESEKPLSGADVSLFGIDAFRYVGLDPDDTDIEVQKEEAQTDHTGICKMSIPEPKGNEKIMWNLMCEAPGYYPFFCGLYEDMDTILEITLKKQEDTAHLKGIVIDMDQKPVKNAKVRINAISIPSQNLRVQVCSWFPKEVATVLTDSEGRFTFTKIPKEYSTVLEVSAEGYATRRFYTRIAKELKELTIQLPPPCEISGRILYEDTGKPAEGMLVAVYSNTGPDFATCRTDKDGVYHFKNLPPGGYYIHAQPLPLSTNTEPPEWIVSPAYASIHATTDRPVTGKDFVLKKGNTYNRQGD